MAKVNINDFAREARQVWRRPFTSTGEQEMLYLFNQEDWSVFRGYNLVSWRDVWSLLLNGATNIPNSRFEAWIVTEFNNRSWDVSTGCINNYALLASTLPVPQQPAVAPRATPTLSNGPGYPTTTGPTPTRIQQRTGNMIILNRMSGDFGATEIALDVSAINIILPYGPQIGGKATGCRIQDCLGEWHNIKESYSDVLSLIPEV